MPLNYLKGHVSVALCVIAVALNIMCWKVYNWDSAV